MTQGPAARPKFDLLSRSLHPPPTPEGDAPQIPGLSPFEPDTPAPITPFILTLILITSARFSTHPAALLLSGYTSRSPLRWSWLELAAALLARQSHGWRDGESAQRPRWPIPRLNGACSGLLGRVVAWYVCPRFPPYPHGLSCWEGLFVCRFEPSSGAVTICKDSKRDLNDSFFGAPQRP